MSEINQWNLLIENLRQKKEKKHKADEIGVDWNRLYGPLPTNDDNEGEAELGDEVEPDGETADV